MTAPKEYPRATSQGTFATVPDTINAGTTVNATSAHTANLLSSFAGKWIYLLAVGGDITVMRGNQTVVLGAGVNMPQGVLVPFYVSESGTYGLSCIADGASRTLYILSDSEAG